MIDPKSLFDHKGAGIFISVLRFEEVCAENLEIPGFVQKKYFFLKSAGKMPISLKVQGKCLYYPSGDLKIVYGRPAGFFVTKKIMF